MEKIILLNPVNFRTVFHKLWLTPLLLLAFSKSGAQQSTNYTLHANIIYRITKYINWPVNNKPGDFIIGIVGESPLYDELKEFAANKKVDKQKIVIIKLPDSAASFNCQILFVAEDESNRFKKVLAKTLNTSTLIISESEGMASEGSCINFVIIDDHLKLEINKKNIESRDLKIASELLQLGLLVK